MRIVLSSLFNFNRRDIALLTKRMWYTHNVAKDVPGNFVIDGKRTSVINIDLYKRILEVENKKDADINCSFKRINNQKFEIYCDGSDKDDDELHG